MSTRGGFGPKQFGWSVKPRSWQGWLAVVVYSLVLAGISQLSIIPHSDKIIYCGLATIVLFAALVLTSGTKGDMRDD